MSAKREPVYFYATLKEGANPNEAKIELEKLSKGLNISVHRFQNVGTVFVAGVCGRAVYERVFNAKLRRETKTIRNLNKGLVRTTRWIELVAAVVPEQLRGQIQSIALSPQIDLTD